MTMHVINTQLLWRFFPAAEAGEDLAKDFVRSDLSGDGAEGGEGCAEVFREEVGGKVTVHAVADPGQGGGSVAQGGGVAGVGDQGTLPGGTPDAGNEGGTQLFEPESRFGGDFEHVLINFLGING